MFYEFYFVCRCQILQYYKDIYTNDFDVRYVLILADHTFGNSLNNKGVDTILKV
jgi:hypothetical protein